MEVIDKKRKPARCVAAGFLRLLFHLGKISAITVLAESEALLFRLLDHLAPEPSMNGFGGITLTISDLARIETPERLVNERTPSVELLRPILDVVRMKTRTEPEQRPPASKKSLGIQ